MNAFIRNDGSPSHRFPAWVLLIFVPALAMAQNAGIQPLDQVGEAATRFVQQQFGAGTPDTVMHVTVAQLDPRLRLPACSTTPEGFAPGALRVATRMTVGVRCAQPQWSVFVPVKVETEMHVLTLRRAVARLAKPAPEDVERQRLRVPGVPTDYLSDLAQLDGRHLKHPAAPGTPLTTQLLVPDTLIKRGQRVTLIASAGGIEVRAQGEAMADATAAGRVRVLNLDSRRVVEGQVESADRVRVIL